MSLGMAVWLNYFRCSTYGEPYVYVQTYNDIYKLMNPVMRLVGATRSIIESSVISFGSASIHFRGCSGISPMWGITSTTTSR